MPRKHFSKRTVLILLAFVIICSGSCKKEYSAGVPSYVDYITDSTWHYVRFDQDLNIDGSIDYSDTPASCKELATYRFLTNNQVIYTPAAAPCDASDVPFTCTYTLQNNGGAISWCGFNGNIKMLNDTVLNIYYDDTTTYNGNTINYRGYLIYKH